MADDIDLSIITLDRSRHVSKVFPPEDGAHFEQDGIYFGADGRLAPKFINDSLKSRLRRMAARRLAEQEAEKARREALRRLGVDPDSPDADGIDGESAVKIAAGAGKSDDGDSEIDVIAYLKGEKLYKLKTVQKAVREKYSREIASKADLIDFMVDNGFVQEAEVKLKPEPVKGE